MSRVGKLPIEVPKEVQVKIEGGLVTVKGPKGELNEKLNEKVNAKIEDGKIVVSVDENASKKTKAIWGLYRNLINNMVIGVTKGFEKKLEVNGVGFRVQGSGRKIILNVGFSHPVEFSLPDKIEGKVEENIITLSGPDKKLIGETAHQIRLIKKPEPYKGKGIKYVDEVLRRKEGKVAAKSE